ncbi:MAG: phosphoglycerate mutase family protein [Bacteroidota bacterium]
MKNYILLLLLLTQLGFSQNKTTTIYLIRHAEKADASKNPDLSEAGLVRANHWNDVFSAVPFDAIYSTNYNRTLQTAKPTATAQKITVVTYDPKEMTLDKIKAAHLGQTILIVGHSNTTPDLVNKLIGQNVYSMMEETTFGNLYIVTINGDIVNHQLLKSL